MTKFTDTLKSQQKTEFKEYYVKYKELKKSIKASKGKCAVLIKENPLLKVQVESIIQKASFDEIQAYMEIMKTPIGETQAEFLSKVEKEIDRVAEFYQQLAKNAIRDCNQILIDRDEWENSHDHFLNAVIENLTHLGNQLVDICAYAELNITAIRKILKKFDKRFNDISIPLAKAFINGQLKRQNSKFINMLNPKVIANINLILEDTYKQLKRIQIERQRESERDDEEEKDRQIQKEVQELTAFEKLQEPLLEEENSLGGAALSSHQYQKTIQTKLKIYKNTLDIISQAIVQIKFSTTFVNISSQAQVMIEAYKDNLSHEAILLQKMSQRSSICIGGLVLRSRPPFMMPRKGPLLAFRGPFEAFPDSLTRNQNPWPPDSLSLCTYPPWSRNEDLVPAIYTVFKFYRCCIKLGIPEAIEATGLELAALMLIHLILKGVPQRSSNSSKEHGYDYDSEKDEEYDDEVIIYIIYQ